MQNLALYAALLTSLATPALADFNAMADREQGFRRGRGGFRGNERSERPGRFVPGRLQHGGNGCPAGTMRVVFAPDNLSFTILFDKFVADTASTDNGQRGGMSCNALLDVTIPDGQQMEITRVDYRGFVSIPQNGRATLHSMFNFLDQNQGRGRWRDRDRINVRYNFQGPITENYEISTGDMNGGRGMQDTEVSPCGGEAQLRINNTVRVQAPQGQQASLTVDSIDGSANAVYYVNWKSCRAPLPPGPVPGPGHGNGPGHRPGCGPRGCPPPPPPPMCGPQGCRGFPGRR